MRRWYHIFTIFLHEKQKYIDTGEKLFPYYKRYSQLFSKETLFIISMKTVFTSTSQNIISEI